MAGPEGGVSLREYFDAKIGALEQAMRDYVRMTDEAHKVQAIELARRLLDLNHAHEKSATDRRDFLRTDVWDAFQAEHRGLMERLATTQAAVVTVKEFQAYKDATALAFSTYKENIDKVLTLAAGKQQGVSMMSYVAVQTVSTFAGIVALVGTLWALLKH